MSEFVAGAFVDVVPDTRNFRSELKRKLENQLKAPFKVPVTADPKRFKSTIQSAVREVKAEVKIQPGTSVRDLRSALGTRVREATKGLKLKVPVEFVDTKTGRARKPGQPRQAVPGDPPGQIPLPGLQRDAQAQLAGLESAQRSGTEEKKKATRETQKLTEEEKRAISVKTQLAAVEKNLAAATRSRTAAAQQGLNADQVGVRLQEARTSANAAVRKANDALAASEGRVTIEQRKSLEESLKKARAQQSEVIALQKTAALDKARAENTNKATKAKQDANVALGVEVRSITKASSLHALENDLLAAEARLKAATNKARDLGNTGRLAENQRILRAIELRKQEIQLRREELRGEGKRTTQQRTGLRGAGATLLSLIGIRGATLAASGAFLAGAAAASIFTKSLQAFATFEQELNVFAAITGATAEEMENVSKAALELGRDVRLPAVTATDAAQAMTELSRAGLSVQDSIAGARGVLELAAAAQISNADAATLAASALNAFGLGGEKATRVADLLANAANAAQGSIAEMGAALQQASAIARQVGLSLDNTVGILTLFARNGLRGSDAGTSLRTSLSRLIAPTKDAAALLDELGINVRDLQGNIRPDVFAQFGEATADIPPALRDMIAQTIAGQDAIRAFAIGAREGARGLRLIQFEMEAEGTAAQVAAARSKGLSGSFSALSSNTQTLGTTIGKVLAPAIKIATDETNAFLTSLNQLATGDFSGFAEGVEKDSKQFVANMKRRGDAIRDAFADPLDLGVAKDSLKQFFTFAPDVDQEAKRIELLMESLDRLSQLRSQAFAVGGNVKGITSEIQRIRAELRASKIDAGLLIPVTPLEKSLAPLRQALKTAKDLRRDLLETGASPDSNIVNELDAQISGFNARIKVSIQAAKTDIKNALDSTDIAKGFKQTFDLIARTPEVATPDVLAGIDDMIRKIKGRAPVAGRAGGDLARQVVASLQSAINAAVAADDPELAAALKKKADAIAKLFGIQFADAFKNIKVPLTGDQIADALLPQRIEVARAAAFGTVQDQIDAKEDERAGLLAQLKNVQKGSAEEEQLLNDIAAADSELQGLRESQAQERKDRQAKADQVVLDAISGEEQKRQNAITLAQETETLADDISTQRKLRAFYLAKIEEVRKTVGDAETRRDELAGLNQSLFDIERDIAEDVRARREQIRDQRVEILDDAAEQASETETLSDDQRTANRKVAFWKKQVEIVRQLVRDRKATAEELKEVIDSLDKAEDAAKDIRRERRAQRRENRQERLDLKIQIAQDTGNVKAEIAAREAQIRNTQALIRQTRRGSLQRLRLIAELRRQQRELQDLKKEKEKTGKLEAELFFEFLQRQQGFAANLLGNLIPGSATSGLVGNAPPPGGAGTDEGPVTSGPPVGRPGSGIPHFLAQGATAGKAAGGVAGPTRGQGSVQIDLLRRIARALERLEKGTGHPEAKNAKKLGGAMADVE